jgi:ATP-dependent protease ClpP protease subunit
MPKGNTMTRSFKAEVKALATAQDTSEIYLYGAIEVRDPDDEYWWMRDSFDASQVIAQIEAIATPNINVYIKSHGGNYFEAVAIRNAFARKQANIIFYLDSIVASAATIIPMVKGQTVVMANNALFMIHAPLSSAMGNAVDLREIAAYLDKLSQGWANVIVEKTGQSYDTIYALLTDGKDHNYTAQEALDFGFIDKIGDAIPVTASALPKNLKLPQAWLTANIITATYQPENANMTGQIKPQPTDTTTVEPQAVLQPDAKAIEAKRQSDIKEIFALVSPERTTIHAMQERMLIDASITPEKAREKILAKIGENAAPVAHSVHVGSSGRDRFIEDGVNAILAKAGVEKISAHNPLRHYRMERIAEECLVQASLAVAGDRMGMIAAAFTQGSSDFPVLLENAMHKTLLASYATAPDTWSRFCATGTVSDFRAHPRYRTGSFGNLDALNELGEFKNKSIPDGEKATMQIGTKGNIINISRQAIINDDLGAFIGLAQNLARAAKRTIEADVYALLASNPTMQDGIALFHASHGNLGTGSLVTMLAVEEARQLMASQKDVSGNDYLDLRPALWLGGMAQGGNARVVNTSVYDPDTANKLQRPNLVNGLFRDVIDTPRIAGNPWYIFADPMEAPVLEVAFLDGQTEPYIEMQQGWNVDGAAYKVRHDYGVAAIDYRGAVKNVGA